jgi:hypothetical protein
MRRVTTRRKEKSYLLTKRLGNLRNPPPDEEIGQPAEPYLARLEAYHLG